MKKYFIFLAATLLVLACNNQKSKGDKMPGEKDSGGKSSDSITYPYKASYSSNYSLGDPNHAKLVLDFIKLWEENKMQEMRALLTDNVSVDFFDGNKFRGSADSLIKGGEEFRANFSSVSITIDGWMPIHANDKNEDFVLVWERDYNTDRQGKVDSIGSHACYQIRNNKIASWSEYQAKLGPPEANK